MYSLEIYSCFKVFFKEKNQDYDIYSLDMYSLDIYTKKKKKKKKKEKESIFIYIFCYLYCKILYIRTCTYMRLRIVGLTNHYRDFFL